MIDELDIDEEVMKVEDYLNSIDYSVDPDYIPSDFALEFVNFIKLVDGGESENKTPVVHFKMIDNFIDTTSNKDTINMCHRGIAKSTLKEYLILYLGVYNELPGFGKVPYGLYVSDSMDNGVKKMRKSLEFRYRNSTFLQRYIPQVNITDSRWEFINKSDVSTVFSGYGAKTGVRGTRENGSRPVLALLDDLVSDSDARSPTIIADIEDTIYKAIDFALHPKRRKIIWSGTPFNAKDPLYKAVESGAWNVNVYPVCEKFPCTRSEFKGSWEDRFDYDYVMKAYKKAKLSGKLNTFYQELMLRIMSDEEKVITPEDIKWYKKALLLKNRTFFNFYITTDFATSDTAASDFSVISVWALNSKGDWFWVDGILKKQLMDGNIDDLFRLVSIYKPLEVGIEVSGQQSGFVPWINEQMMNRNIFFTMTSQNNNRKPGIRPTNDKLTRFRVIEPNFKMGKMYFPEEMKNTEIMIEAMDELGLITLNGFRSKHDDFIDTVSMLPLLNTFKPSFYGDVDENVLDGDLWDNGSESSSIDSYIV